VSIVKILNGLTVALMMYSPPVSAQQLWCWRFEGEGVLAAGSLVTANTMDAGDFWSITAITGFANSAAVIALQPAGTSVPGNSGFPVDNLIRATPPHSDDAWVWVVASDGAYHNPFHMDQYRDYISRPPYADGKGAEPTIQFKVITASDSRCPAP